MSEAKVLTPNLSFLMNISVQHNINENITSEMLIVGLENCPKIAKTVVISSKCNKTATDVLRKYINTEGYYWLLFVLYSGVITVVCVA